MGLSAWERVCDPVRVCLRAETPGGARRRPAEVFQVRECHLSAYLVPKQGRGGGTADPGRREVVARGGTETEPTAIEEQARGVRKG